MCPYFGTKSVRGKVSSNTAFFFVNKIENITKKACRFKRTIFFLTVALLGIVCQALPIISPSKGNLSNSAVSQAVIYLTKYGYLPPSDPASGSLRTESQLREAISTMQLFGGLEPTGLLDEGTLELMRRRRCGVSDVIPGGPYRVKRYAIQGQKWPSTNLSWSVKSRDSKADIRMVRSQLRKAFEVWSAASALTFEEVQGPSADILVSFLKGQHGDGYPFDGEGAVLAHAFFPGEGIGGDAHFDADERWLSSQPEDEDEGVNLFAVAAHEIGHSLGLSHSSTPGSLMFPYYQVMGEYFTLPKDDADGIRHLYGYKDLDSQPTMPSLTSTTVRTTSTRRGKFSTKQTTPKPRKAATTTSPTPEPQIPDMCNTSIDAISVIRREIFIFKGKHFWRLNMNRTLRAGYPVSIERFWHALPDDIERVDALYERPIDTKIVFFTGKKFWLFSANQLEPGYPRPLTDFGLPDDLERIDAALVWGHNGKTYFFSGKEYWKFDENEGRVELDYPRNINSWRGVPANIDAAFQWTDGNSYFFKGTKFWKFVDIKMRIQNKSPSDLGGFWFKCPGKSMEITQPVTTARSPAFKAEVPNISPVLKISQIYWLILLILSVHMRMQLII
ncbi:matrix metalloproteinase-17 [Trichonephila clavata]|uniref:Matrix metalloproteinase-17 n=1 Tax=Trichonephila clavata TaxID=2740835 RepID=A0A8X6L792_TRICU|nr:matrix metalloproteinase-17 [Trichonephila clavata]